MKAIKGQISLFDMMTLLGCELGTEEPPVLLQTGQTVYVVKRGDVKEARVLDETWLCNETRGYRLQYGTGTYDTVWNTSIEENCFLDMAPAVAKAEKYLSEHDVILAEDIHAVSINAYRYIRECDGYTMTAFYCELDNGMLYIKEFYTYHHIIVDSKKQRKAIQKFMEQNDITNGNAVKIDYEPVFKNMYRIRQQYDWDYAEAGHSYAIG